MEQVVTRQSGLTQTHSKGKGAVGDGWSGAKWVNQHSKVTCQVTVVCVTSFKRQLNPMCVD